MALLLAGFFALIFLSQGITAPFSKDQEPQSAQWIAGFAEHGDWLISQDYYGYLCRKPPLFYWLSAIVVDATGGVVDAVRTRTVSLAAGVAVALEVMAFSATTLGETAGWLAFLFILGSYAFASRATVNLTDMLMTALMFGGYLLIYPLLEQPPRRVGLFDRRVHAAAILMGLAILTKGPVTLLLCALAVAVYLLMERRNPLRLLARAWPWEIVGIALAMGLAWYMPTWLAVGKPFLKVVLEENLGHFLPATMGGTGEAARPFYYIVARLFGGTLPQSLLLPALVVAASVPAFKSEAYRPLKFQLAMVLTVVVFFSLASAKRDDYILPATPGLAILFAALFTSLEPSARGSRKLTRLLRDLTVVAAAVSMIGMLVAGAVLSRSGGNTASLHLELQSSDAAMLHLFVHGFSALHPEVIAISAAMLAAAVMTIYALKRRSEWLLGLGFALLSLGGVSLVTGTIRPELSRNRSACEFAPRVRRALRGEPLFVIGEPNYDFSFYFGAGVPVFNPHRLPEARPIFVVARPRQLSRLAPRYRRLARLVMPSTVGGGGGTLGLYQLMLPATNRLEHLTIGAKKERKR